MTRAAAAAAIALLSSCAGLGVGPSLHLALTNTGPVPIDVTYVSEGIRRSTNVPACSRIVVSIPRTDHWSLIIDDIPYESSRDGAVQEIEGTLTLPIHFDGSGAGFDAPVSGTPGAVEPSIGTEC